MKLPLLIVGRGPLAHRALSDSPLFGGLSPRQLSKLRSYLSVQRYADTATIVSPDEPAEGCYLVLEGAVELTAPGAAPEVCEPGAVVGELSLLGNNLPPATAVTQGPAQLAYLSRDALASMEQNSPHMAAQVLMNLSVLLGRRFRWLNAALAALPSEDSGEYAREAVE